MNESSWPVVAMGDVMAEFYDGPHATPPPADDGPVYLGIKNLSESGHLDLSHVRHIAESDFPTWTRRVDPKPGDIVFTYEATLHRYAIIPNGFRGSLGRRIALIRPDESKIDRRYLHYYLLSPQWRRTVEQRINVGSTVDRIPLTEFPNYPVPLPPLSHQRAVVAALGAIDDLIENNRRRIEILEEMARLIYREWFVHFRFPGHDDVELIDSDRGPIPEGWSLTTLGEAAEWKSGGTPSTTNPDYWGGDIPWITSGSLSSFLLDDSDRKLTPLGVGNGTKVVERDTMIFVVRGMSLTKEFRHGIADRSVAFGQDCKALIALDNIDPLYLAFAVSSLAGDIQRMVEFAAHGTGKLSTDRVQAISIPHPPAVVQQQFAGVVRPMRELMSNLRGQLRVLREARDLLLPRLISGELDVSGLDLDLESVA